jgi:hypothetical protein
MAETETFEVAWNLSQALIMEISNLLQRANNHYLKGELDKAFYCLKAIKFRIIQDLNPEERKVLSDLEDTYSQLIHALAEFTSSPNNAKNNMPENVIKISKQKGPEGYEKYNETLMDLLGKYGYTISKKEDRTFLGV